VAQEDLEHRELARAELDRPPVDVRAPGPQVEADLAARSTVCSAVPASRRRTRTLASSSSKRKGFVR